MNPTEEQLLNRLNPIPTTVNTPSTGLFRATGNLGDAIYGTDPTSGKLVTYNLSSLNTGATYGDRFPIMQNALKSNYGIDYSSLPEVNLGDYLQQLSRKGIGYNTAEGSFTGYSIEGDLNALKSFQPKATLQSTTINNTPNTLATPITSSQGKSPTDLVNEIQNQGQPYPNVNLQPGATGSEVKKLQDYLVSQGLMTREQVNTGYGTYGPQTTAAVKALQERLGVDNSTGVGYFGPRTIAAIQGQTQGTSSQGGNTNATTGQTGASGGTSTPTGGAPAYNTSTQARNQTREAGIAAQKAELERGLQAPTPFKSVAEFDKLRAEKGVVADEAELQAIQNEARMAQEEMRIFKSQNAKEITQGGFTGAVSEAERNMSFRLDSLALREQAVTARLNAKNAYINTVLNLGKEDYQTAYTNYTNEYNKNVKAIDLYNSELDDQQKDALTGFTTMANLLAKSGLSQLPPQISTQLDSLALKAGLPTGVFQQALKGISAQEKIDNMKVVGNNVYMWTTDAQGNPHLKLVQSVSDGKDKGGFGNYTEDQLKAITKINQDVSKNSTYTKTTSMRNYGDNVVASLSLGSGVGDIAAINQFQKVIDEGAVTRDQDVKLIQSSQSLANTLKTKIKNLEKGEQLSPELRKQMREAVEAMYNKQVEALQKDPYIAAKTKEAGLYGLTVADTILGELGGFVSGSNSGSQETSFDNTEWMSDYNYDRDIQYAREAIEAGADKAQVEAILKQKYLNVQL